MCEVMGSAAQSPAWQCQYCLRCPGGEAHLCRMVRARGTERSSELPQVTQLSSAELRLAHGQPGLSRRLATALHGPPEFTWLRSVASLCPENRIAVSLARFCLLGLGPCLTFPALAHAHSLLIPFRVVCIINGTCPSPVQIPCHKAVATT